MAVAYRSGAVNPSTNEVIYKDIPLNFLPHPVTKRINPIVNEKAISRAVRNLLLTNKYERPYKPNFGGNILALLFENMSPVLSIEVKDQIQNAIRIYEKRAILEDVRVIQKDDNNTLDITVVFRPSNNVDSVQLSFTVERIR